MPLVDTIETEEVRSGACGGGGLFVVPRNHGNIVTEDTECAASAVDLLGEDVLVCKQARKLQIGVGDCSLWVVCRDQPGLYVWREGSAPQQGGDMTVCCGWEPNAPHSQNGGIMRAYCNGIIWNNLGQVSGTGGQ
jgi:hypothetical protein